ncbi:MAG: CDGSH iron-sulfur domain-containing protein [Oryzomonas sp.]|uniref:CDGSH iron-sulfur domain-containing protein n=1 Tax=Oryzomonas sp. TaxID=2855186 RepID=UPI0028428B95|nr:CDGSH iron-sulfur domain-containing protein [Oryzomonas sp.]MDR3580194.1 CDGSH iron-sulfur domain-containing protein [Oryzomonas sp.]
MSQIGPIAIELEAGTYYRCMCGKSAKAPFCDGSHVGTEKTPLAFDVEEKKEVHLCACGKTGNMAYCDGSHNK